MANKFVTMLFNIDKETAARLEMMSRRTGQPVSAIARTALQELLTRWEAGRAEKHAPETLTQAFEREQLLPAEMAEQKEV
jgi:hypothetical protein